MLHGMATCATQGVYHASTLWEYLKISYGAKRLHVSKNEIIIKWYHTYACA